MALSSGRWSALWSPLGTVQVRPLGPPLPLGTLPLGNVREAIRAALAAQEREDRYPIWLTSAQCQPAQLRKPGASWPVRATYSV